MKDHKIFEAPRITFLQMASKDVITTSADEIPAAVFGDQLDIWDKYDA